MKHRIDISEIPAPNEPFLIEGEGRESALFNVEGKLFATDEECPHAGWKLSEGGLSGSIVPCLLHGAEIDVRNGKCVGGLTCSDVQSYPLEEKDGELFIELD